MPITHSNSTSNPLDSRVLAQAIDLVLKAESMGMLTVEVDTLNLDIDCLIAVVREIVAFGIGIRVVVNPETWREYSSDDLCQKLRLLGESLEDSPLPACEWRKLRKLLSDELLSKMTGVAEISIRRYSSGERDTPNDVAERLHWLALVAGDLHGAYNDNGVRNWFSRPRKSFNDLPPIAILGNGNWSPNDDNVSKIRNFVRSLVESMGT